MFINTSSNAKQHIINSIKTSIINQLKQEGLINKEEFQILKEKIK